MIRTKNDLKYYLASDKKALNIRRRKPQLLGDEIWKYQIALRKLEYYTNNSGGVNSLLKAYWRFRHHYLGVKLGFTIPINVFEEGLCLYHYGSIIVSKYAKVGKWCSIHGCVNIGQNWNHNESPTIGNFCFIGPGAKIFGNIILGDRIAIGANSVVNKSFAESDITIAGIPAKKIKDKGTP